MYYYEYFLLFLIYSSIGWILEVLCKLFEEKRFINRGFLIGPYCPIYGWGCMLITILLKKYYYDPIVLFFMAIIICSFLEYFTSLIMEKIFKVRWWDYSNRRFNINGRICLETMVPFGLLSLLIMYIVNPFFIKSVMLIPNKICFVISLILFIIYIIDNIISIKVIFNLKGIIQNVKKDSTELIREKVRKIINEKNILNRRLFKAFPHIEFKIVKFKDIKKYINKKRKN